MPPFKLTEEERKSLRMRARILAERFSHPDHLPGTPSALVISTIADALADDMERIVHQRIMDRGQL